MVAPAEPEFEQAKAEIYETLGPLLDKQPEFKRLLAVVQIPERVIQFRVVWQDDKNQLQVNTGYRVQFNSALGPYKGGLRFHPTVSLSILKFLGFEQIFKNALTGQSIGGGKGGADFDPKGRSDNEIRNFCDAFMRELSRHIGDNTDVPAGDIGVGGREIGFLFGAYKRYRNEWSGILTGKGATWGGSHIRPEATGYGVIYYVQHMIAEAEKIPIEDTFKGKTVAISGSGNVAQYAALKAIELGAKVVSLSDSKGLLQSTDGGITPDEIHKIAELKLKRLAVDPTIDGYLKDAGLSQHKYVDGARPWEKFPKLDIALPCATQNEVSGPEADALVAAGVKYVAEGSNMGSTKEAIDIFEAARASGGLWYAPGKAANCGGVAVSALEMAQNSARLKWTPQEVDAKLFDIMSTCYKTCFDTARSYDTSGGQPSLVAGANSRSSQLHVQFKSSVHAVAGFLKVANAMKAHGDFW